MSERPILRSRTVLAWVVVGIAIMLVLVLHTIILRPYLAARRLVEGRLSEGRPIVAAVYEFQRSNGRWPDAIQDLVPKFLPEFPSIDGNWSYVTSVNEPPVLSGDAGPGRRLMYGFPSRTASLLPSGTDHGWIIDGRDGESFVATD